MARFVWFPLILMILLAACGESPKAIADDWADRFPEEIGVWEQDGDRLELTAENQGSSGHITLSYAYDGEADIEALAYLSIDVFATETAANVELGKWMRSHELDGYRFVRERLRGTPVDVTTTAGGYIAYFQSDETVITLQVAPAYEDEDAQTFYSLPTEDIEAFLETIIAIDDNRE